MINQRILIYLAHRYPAAFTHTWLHETEAGERYRQGHREVTEYQANHFTRIFTDTVIADNWKLAGALPYGKKMTIMCFEKVDREILIIVHNDKGDIYGVFEKINENRTEVLLRILAVDRERDIVQQLQTVSDKLSAARNALNEFPVTVDGLAGALFQVNEADRILGELRGKK